MRLPPSHQETVNEPRWRVVVRISLAEETTGANTAYAHAVLERELASLRSAPVGQRNKL